MTNKKRYKLEYITMCIFVTFMVIGSFGDKFISQHVINQDSLIATFFQIFGSVAPPLILFISSAIIYLYALNKLNDKLAKLAVSSISLIGSIYAIWQIVKKCSSRLLCAIKNFQNNIPIGIDTSDKILIKGKYLIFMICVTAILWFIGIHLIKTWINKVQQSELQRLLWISLGGIIAFFLRNIFIDTMKDLWGRWRPREQLNNWNHFTSWFIINGKNGHQSFPSGHSASAWLALYLPLFVDPINHKKTRYIIFIITCIWGFLVSSSRIFIGAHFLSDVTTGGFISVIIVYCLSRILNENISGQDMK